MSTFDARMFDCSYTSIFAITSKYGVPEIDFHHGKSTFSYFAELSNNCNELEIKCQT